MTAGKARRLRLSFLIGALLTVGLAPSAEAGSVKDYLRYCVDYILSSVWHSEPLDPSVYSASELPRHSVTELLRKYRAKYQTVQAEQANLAAIGVTSNTDMDEILRQVEYGMRSTVEAYRQEGVDGKRSFANARRFGDVTAVSDKFLPDFLFGELPTHPITPSLRQDFSFRFRSLICPENGYDGYSGARLTNMASYLANTITHSLHIDHTSLWSGKYTRILGYQWDRLGQGQGQRGGTSVYLLHPDPRTAHQILDDAIDRLERARELPFGDPERKREWARAWFAYVAGQFYEFGEHEIGVPFFAGTYLGLTGKKLKYIPNPDELLFYAFFSQEGFADRLLRKVE